LVFDVTTIVSGAGTAVKVAGKVGNVTLKISKATLKKVVSGGGKVTAKELDEILRASSKSLLTENLTLEQLAAQSGLSTEAILLDRGACFAAGTPLLTPTGSKSIEQFVPGDLVLSRDEYDIEGVVTPKVVEEVFVHLAEVAEVHVGGRVIGTTLGHPFWVQGKGWVPARELVAGDRLVGHDGQWVVVEQVVETGQWTTVYNMRIADFHTYFVGCAEWGFSVWAHNHCYDAWLFDHGIKGTPELRAIFETVENTGALPPGSQAIVEAAVTKGGLSLSPTRKRLAWEDVLDVQRRWSRIRTRTGDFTAHEWGNPKTVPCFPADTVVHTPLGRKAIQSLQEGDEVLAYNERDGCVAARRVVARLRNWTQHLVRIDVDGDIIHATRNHPFFDPVRRLWLEAAKLEPGVTVIDCEQHWRVVASVAIVATEEVTYNIEVEELHTYFVGERGLLVHNSGFESTVKTYTEIYIVKDVSGKVVYVGQTVQGIDVRYNQHLGDGHPHWKNGYTKERAFGGNWTAYGAAVWEQHYIDLNGGLKKLENSKVAISADKYAQYKNLHNPC
jgi:hypothetical protein